jgi:hypothetical protein
VGAGAGEVDHVREEEEFADMVGDGGLVWACVAEVGQAVEEREGDGGGEGVCREEDVDRGERGQVRREGHVRRGPARDVPNRDGVLVEGVGVEVGDEVDDDGEWMFGELAGGAVVGCGGVQPLAVLRGKAGEGRILPQRLQLDTKLGSDEFLLVLLLSHRDDVGQ